MKGSDSMQTLEYFGVMSTPRGCCIGTIIVKIDHEFISGTIHFFEKNGEYRGELDSRGNLKISGVLPTLKDNVIFQGIGKITFNALHLELKAEEYLYEINATNKNR